jgi:FAD/FMN-containing dehydrogenase
VNKRELICYETDASRIVGKAEKVVFPENLEDVKKVVKTAGFDLVPRGAGTGFVGGVVPNNSIVVDMSKMTLVSNFSASKKNVRVEAGVTVKELNEKLGSVGYEFPICPANTGISSIGGMIATNASGNRSMKYGVMKDWIDEIEFVNGKVELIKTSKADVMEVCGMEGITGIIVGASLRVIPKISRSISVFQSDSLEEVLSIARKLKQEKDTCMLAFFSKIVSKMLGFPESYHIIIEFDSSRGKVVGEEYEKLFRIKERAYTTLFSEGYYNSEDPRLFFDTIKEFVLFLEQNQIPYFGDLGTGIIHPFFKDSEKTKRNLVVELIKKMRFKLGKYGYGLTRKHFLDDFDSRLINRVKLRQDPNEKFNNKKLIDAVSPVLKEKEAAEKRVVREELFPRKIEMGKASSISKEIENSIIPAESDRLVENKKTHEKLVSEAKKELDSQTVKSPEEKLNEFIKKVEVLDKEKNPDELKKELVKIEEDLAKEEIKERLKDYEDTFDSELSPEKSKKIEDFARQVPREIIHEQEFKRPPRPAVDLKAIQNIMTNNKNNVNTIGRVSVSDNLDQKSENSVGMRLGDMKRSEVSDKEKDIINKILGNRYKKSGAERSDSQNNNQNNGGGN